MYSNNEGNPQSRLRKCRPCNEVNSHEIENFHAVSLIGRITEQISTTHSCLNRVRSGACVLAYGQGCMRRCGTCQVELRRARETASDRSFTLELWAYGNDGLSLVTRAKRFVETRLTTNDLFARFR